MKLALALLLSAPCGAFVAPSSRTPLTVSFGAYDDAVAEAVAVTSKFGFSSAEAKTACVRRRPFSPHPLWGLHPVGSDDQSPRAARLAAAARRAAAAADRRETSTTENPPRVAGGPRSRRSRRRTGTRLRARPAPAPTRAREGARGRAVPRRAVGSFVRSFVRSVGRSVRRAGGRAVDLVPRRRLKPGLDEESREYKNSMEELSALIATSKAKSETIKVQLSKFSSAPLPTASTGAPAASFGWKKNSSLWSDRS